MVKLHRDVSVVRCIYLQSCFGFLSNYFYHLFMVRSQPTLGEMTSFCYNIINQKITVSFGFFLGGGWYSNTGNHLHLEKLRVTFVQLDNKLAVSYGNWSYIAVFTTAYHRALSCVRWFQSITLPFVWKIYLNMIFPTKPNSPNWSLLSGFSTSILFAFLL